MIRGVTFMKVLRLLRLYVYTPTNPMLCGCIFYKRESIRKIVIKDESQYIGLSNESTKFIFLSDRFILKLLWDCEFGLQPEEMVCFLANKLSR